MNLMGRIMSWFNCQHRASKERALLEPAEEDRLASAIKEATTRNREATRRLFKASHDQATRAADVELIIDCATRQLRLHQAEEAFRAVERERVMAAVENALSVAKGLARK
jgi:hypothetical protein